MGSSPEVGGTPFRLVMHEVKVPCQFLHALVEGQAVVAGIEHLD